MVEVVCDTSFLIHLATKRIKNLDNLDTEIGQIQFVVPSVVINELQKLCENETKKQQASSTLEFVKTLKKITISGSALAVDEAIVSHVRDHTGIVATLDMELKKRIKESGGSVISLSNDRIVLEPSKI